MKNHILFKFIAIVLCAASLLGAVGGAIGVFVLTEAGLYNKTPDQVYQERIESDTQYYANELALRYASRNLGGCPDAMIGNHYDSWFHSIFDSQSVGYVLKDAEGTVLSHKDLEDNRNAVTYRYAVDGQYMHLVDTITESELLAQEEADRLKYNPTVGSHTDIFDMIPSDGADIYHMDLLLSDSGSFSTGGERIGTVFHNRDGLVVFRMEPFAFGFSSPQETVTAITLLDQNGEMIYDANSPNGIGILTHSEDMSGESIFLSTYRIEEPAPAEVAPAVTAPAEETVSATTALEETVPETTVAEDPDSEEAADDEAAEKEEPSEKKGEEAEKEKKSEKKDEEAEKEEKSEKKDEEAEKEEKSEKKDEEAEKEEKSEKKDEEAEKEEKSEKKDEDSEKEEKSEKKDEEAKKEDTAEDAEETESTEAAAETAEAPTEPSAPETVPEETVPLETEPVLINGKPLNTYQINRTEYFDHDLQEPVTAKYVYLPLPQLTVELMIAPGATQYDYAYTLLQSLHAIRGYLLPVIGICLLMLAVCVVYLCSAAGRTPKSEEIRAGGLNRMPLDLYCFITITAVTCIILVIVEGGDYLLRRNILVGCSFAAGMAYFASLTVVGCFFAIVAQFKTPGGFWWRNSLVGWCLKLAVVLWKQFIRLLVWLEGILAAKALPAFARLLKRIGKIIRQFFTWLGGKFNRLFSMLPLTWQWLVVGFAIVLLLFIAIASRSEGMLVLCLCAGFAITLYGAHCFGILLETTKRMNKGNLDSKVDDKLMVGSFKEFAGDLNDLAGVAVVAAQKQLKSERMKTELITNVSHDIKTPLTSIINYVDLLQKPHTEEEQVQYLEVLDRQSQRLKKLIDDLMDMSKASTGNMAVDITIVDAVESVNQALGEFGDKLDRAMLMPVFRHAQESVPMMADGKLVWRVLSNLLSNAVKYALPGTRLYIDLMQLDGKVILSLKNISRDELNVDAEELMERFVRGDDSRNTEGSGLGLNIAKSLMELQHGQLQMLVDGDLFKVTLIFPGAE